MTKILSPRIEDYLETILLLEDENKAVSLTAVAKERMVSVPSARTAIQKLKHANLVMHERYGKIVLTDKGRELAREVYHIHEVLFSFLHDFLNVPNEQAEDEACKMEHILSYESLHRLVEFLDHVPKQT